MAKKITGAVRIPDLVGGYNGLIEETGTSFTLAAKNLHRFTRATNASAIAVTLPLDLEIEEGEWMQLIQGGAGAITVTGVAGVTVNAADAGSKATAAAYGALHIRCVGNNTYIVI